MKDKIKSYLDTVVSAILFGGGVMFGAWGVACIIDILTK